MRRSYAGTSTYRLIAARFDFTSRKTLVVGGHLIELSAIQMGHRNVKQQHVVSVLQRSILLLRMTRFARAKAQANSDPVLAASLGPIQDAIRRYSCRRSVPRAGDPPNLSFSTSRIALPPLKTMTLPVDSLTVTAVALVTAVIPAAA